MRDYQKGENRYERRAVDVGVKSIQGKAPYCRRQATISDMSV